MRRILIENARRKQRLRHGGNHQKGALTPDQLAIEPPSDDILALDEALVELARIDPSKAEIENLRDFLGLARERVAQALDISPATARRNWIYAKSRLFRRILDSNCTFFFIF